jgi:hypothetical protein
LCYRRGRHVPERPTYFQGVARGGH